MYTKKPFHHKSLKESLLERWNPKVELNSRKLAVIYLCSLLVLRKLDKVKSIQYGPWTFDKALVLLEEPNANVVQPYIHLHDADFWVQCHNVPLGKMTTNMQNPWK